MTSTKQTLLAAALVAAGTTSFQANASIQWSFDIGGCNPDASSVGNVCTFEPIASTVPNGLNVLNADVTAWANTGSSGGLEQAIMRDHGSNGAGVRHANGGGWETTQSPQHAMDNDNYLEFMLFDFQDQEVQLTDLTLGWETDSDMSILAYMGDGAPNLAAGNVTNGGSENIIDANDGWVSVAQIANVNGSFNFSSLSNGVTSSYWLVATYASAFGNCNIGSGGCGQGQDHVKLWDVGGHVFSPPDPPTSTPAPGSALLLAGLLPLMRRRR